MMGLLSGGRVAKLEGRDRVGAVGKRSADGGGVRGGGGRRKIIINKK